MSDVLMNAESSANLLDDIAGGVLLTGEHQSPAANAAKIENVKLADVQAVSNII